MSFLDKLKEVIKAHLKIEIGDINLFSNISIVINKEEKPSKVGNIVYVPAKLVRDQLPSAIQEGVTLLAEDSKKTLIEYSESESRNENTLNYFKVLINPEDYQILRASLYVRDCFEKHEGSTKIDDLRNDIFNKYGKRGGRISNLCTSGYFEKYFKPLYDGLKQSMESAEEAKARFSSVYELVVGSENALAIFINQDMNLEHILEKIREAIQSSKKYEIPFFCVHGIGKQNCINIRKAMLQLRDEYNFTEDCTEEGQIIASTVRNIRDKES